MELLVKKVVGPNRKEDNADKRPLFAKERHPHRAAQLREQWAFVADPVLRENISYQLQYLEFLVNLYNDYQIYLTVESLLCKDILSTVASIVEAALFDAIASAKAAAGMPMSERTEFVALLGEAYRSFGLLDKDMWNYLHELRKVRNYVHLRAADFQEHTAYTVEEANEAIERLEQFRQSLAR